MDSSLRGPGEEFTASWLGQGLSTPVLVHRDSGSWDTAVKLFREEQGKCKDIWNWLAIFLGDFFFSLHQRIYNLSHLPLPLHTNHYFL